MAHIPWGDVVFNSKSSWDRLFFIILFVEILMELTGELVAGSDLGLPVAGLPVNVKGQAGRAADSR